MRWSEVRGMETPNMEELVHEGEQEAEAEAEGASGGILCSVLYIAQVSDLSV
jgi:hypothetical protein